MAVHIHFARAPVTCHPQMPAVKEAYCAMFTPPTLALLCEGAALEFRLGTMAGIEDGFIWAAVRAIERNEGDCPALSSLRSHEMEKCYAKLYRRLPHDVTAQRIEKAQGMNLLSGLPPRCRPTDRPLEFRQPLTPGMLLAEIMAQFDYMHAVNLPLRQLGIDVQKVCEALQGPEGFVAGEALIRRGTVPSAQEPLYHKACEKAAFVGAWLVRDLHVAAAAKDLGLLGEFGSRADALLEEWDKEVAFARDHVSGAGCVFLCAFPGPRPWLASACGWLGVGSVTQ